MALHLDVYLLELVQVHGIWVYAILFLVVFCETGLIITPFLPGDSLLFAAGTVAAMGALSPATLIVLLIVAAIIGDAVNYSVGRAFGDRVERVRFVNRHHLRLTSEFYERHGGKTIILARFIPIIRTFAPFAAGIGRMTYRRFAFYNVSGAVIWVVSFVLAGYVFGTIPLVRDNLTLVMVGIVVISILPPFVSAFRRRISRRSAPSAAAVPNSPATHIAGGR